MVLIMKYEIYTDGACSVSLMLGGYAAIVQNENKERIIVAGSKVKATNNEMEILAVIAGIKSIIGLKPTDKIVIYSDSAYVINCIKCKWYEKWIQNGWRTSDNKVVKNKKLWLQLIGLLDSAEMSFVKVKGHSGIEFNEMVDRLAVKEVERLKQICKMS